MSRRVLGLALLALLVTLAIWWLGRTKESSSGSPAPWWRFHDDPGFGDSPPAARGGVVSREVDAASVIVEAQVVDDEGNPVRAGTVVLSCLADGEVSRIQGGAVQLGDDGSLFGPGCRGEVCVELFHPFLVPAEPWILRPGSRSVALQARAVPRLYGQVLTATREPVAGAKVAFVPPDGNDDPTAVVPLATRNTSTDADGRFSVAFIERPPCNRCQRISRGCDLGELPTYEEFGVVARKSGWGPAQITYETGGGLGLAFDDPLRIELPPGGDVLSGQVLDANGRPYPRAYVLVRSAQRLHEQHRAELTDGNFEVGDLGSGRYHVRVLQDGVELATAQGAAPGDDVELVGGLRADGPDLIVRVVDPAGEAISGVRVNGGPFQDARTDMKGEVRVKAALPGSLLLRLSRPGRGSALHTVIVTDPPHHAPGAKLQLAVVEL